MIPSIAIIGRVSIHARSCGRQPQYYTNPMRVAFRRHRELGHVRIRIGSQRAHVTFPKTGKLFDECNPAGKSIHPSVACHLRADTGALIAVLPADRLRFDFSRSLKASGGLSALVKFCQEPASGFTQSLKSFSSVLFHAYKETHGAIEWNEKVFPNLTKVLVKVT